MAKYKLQEMPDVQNKGEKRVYPKLVANRTLNTQEFVGSGKPQGLGKKGEKLT